MNTAVAIAPVIADDSKREVALLKAVGLDRANPEQRELAINIANRYGLDLLFWRASCSVYRKDMSRPFTYTGRYPTKGGNQRFAPEMATKVAEVMALRRAFDVAAPTAEERWDIEVPADPPPPKATLAERVAEKVAEVASPPTVPAVDESAVAASQSPSPEPPPVSVAESVPAPDLCGSLSRYDGVTPCVLPAGHEGNHKASSRESWNAA
jgi:hypothetical protein